MRLFTLLQTAFTKITNNTNKISKITAACSAKGNVSSLSLAASKKTTVPLNTWITRTDTAFTFSNDGIKCPYDGTVMISGGVYISGGANITCGCYINQNGAEITSQWLMTSAGGLTGGCKIITVSAGDIITLVARRTEAGTCVPNNKATHLDIVYLA
nr:MAG TPA: Complement C1q-like protein [Caudoviricetes sp.]